MPVSDDEASRVPSKLIRKQPGKKPTNNTTKVMGTKKTSEATKKDRELKINLKLPPAHEPPTKKVDIFDVPSSDDEAAAITPKPSRKQALKMGINQVPKTTSNKDPSAMVAHDLEQRKRIKLSPTREPLPRRLPINTKVQQPKSQIALQAPTRYNALPGRVQITELVAARPKPDERQRKQFQPGTPKKLSPAPQHAVSMPNTPSPPLSDVDMMDVDPDGKYISPKAIHMWKGLLESADEIEVDVAMESSDGTSRRTTPGRVSGTPGRLPGKTLFKAAGVSKHPPKSPSLKVPRRRLIDFLVEQAPNEDTDDDSERDEAEPITNYQPNLDPVIGSTSRSQSVVAEAVPPPPSLTSGSQGSQIAGPKFTYGRQRSMLAEQDLMQELALGFPSQPEVPQNRRPRRGSIPVLKPLTSFHEEDEDDEGAGATIRSVHELRQAGANTRFLDEIDDIIDQIGKPNSTQASIRRSGLLSLSSKMKDKNFARQFRATGAEQRLFVHLGQETDVVAGFVMVSLLVAVLVEGSMSHIVAHLRRQGITRLLIRLLDTDASINAVGKERKNNMSKIAQSLLSEHHDYLLQMSVWEELQPEVLSPRTLALKYLELMIRQTREAGNSGDIFSKELTTKLFSILKTASSESSWDLPKGKQAIDFCLALSALESHSITARTVQDESIWISEFLPIIADALEIALSRPLDTFGVLQVLILRLTLNVTNNNVKASDVFARPALLSAMGLAIVAKFKQISRFLTEEIFSMAVDHLILVLGVMINFAEWSSTARESLQSLDGKSDDPLDRMAQIFVDNQESMSEVRLQIFLIYMIY